MKKKSNNIALVGQTQTVFGFKSGGISKSRAKQEQANR